MIYNYEYLYNKLKSSKFRASFSLDASDIEYLDKKGYEEIRRHAMDFIDKRLAEYNPEKDGKQTPMRGHPVFRAQHATATCCRGCMEKWHKIEKTHSLNDIEKDFVLNLIMYWLKREYLIRKNSK